MSAIRDYFKKKKLQAKFKVAGPGQKLSDSRPPVVTTQPKPAPIAQQPKPSQNTATSAAAEAALKRLQQQEKKETNKVLGLVWDEERRKVLEEMRQKEEAQIHKGQKSEISQTQENLPTRRKFICPTLGITDGYFVEELKRMIEEGIRDSYKDDMLLMGALLIKNCNDEQKMDSCISTLELILGNLKTEDEEALQKFKRVKKAKIQQKILSINGGSEFLEAVGFVLDENQEWYNLQCENKDIKERVEYCSDVLRNAEKFELEMDREMVVRNANEFPSLVEFDDEFFELTVDDIKQQQEALTKVKTQGEMLMTKAMRKKIEKPVPDLCRLRVKITETKFVDVTFKVKETLQDLVTWLQRNFSSDLSEFHLIFNQKVIPEENYSKTFEELNFYPKVALFVKAKSA
ncbi:UBX domain-containing protein 6-like protein [Dinothrombium tinctorium]|uniref:UBX domain-containing protein 6-like protein n=1 Tax=Dinothrombium tinctorium TaxID=1965070 RepID=A0A443REX2_9ACAR|nr:UBX domain-containing protein 6-like protein [Dinothrombium tinctorium]